MYNNLVNKIINEYDGNIKPLIIPNNLTNETDICNPSLFIEYDTLHCILTNVEDITLNLHGEFMFKYDDDIKNNEFKTNNFYCEIDINSLQIQKVNIVDTEKLDTIPICSRPRGLEDASIIIWDNKKLLVTKRDTTINGQRIIELSEIEIYDDKVNEIKRTKLEVSNIDSDCEQNWMPIVDKPYHFVKCTNRVEVVKVDLNTNQSDNVFVSDKIYALPNDIRGGTPLVRINDDFYLCIIREVIFIPNYDCNTEPYYYHRFILFNNDFTINYISEQFNFMTSTVEFCTGLAIYKTDVFISYGFQYNCSFIIKLNKENLLKLIKNLNVDIDLICENENLICENENLIYENENLINFIYDPFNDLINFNLAFYYDEQKQSVEAYCFYLRCCNFTKNIDLAYESLLRMSLCVTKNRYNKELCCIQQALSLNPKRPEANYIMSLYYSYRNKWLESYMFACNGLSNINNNYKPLLKNIGYCDKYQLLFQKAYTGYQTGKLNESKILYFDLLNNYPINDEFHTVIQNNLNQYPIPYSKPILYKNKNKNKLRYKFKNCDKITENYSQIYQDIFVLMCLNGKFSGIYLEIGSGNFKYGNNTLLLENDFEWKGLSIDNNKELVDNFNLNRKNKCICSDATRINYSEVLKKFDTNIIDYLQIDCDPPNITFQILLNIPFDEYKFRVITYEHDYYNDNTLSFRKLSREFLINKGYQLVVGNISPNIKNEPYEDWWVKPELIDKNILDKLLFNDIDYICGEEYILSTNVLKKIGINIGAGMGETYELFNDDFGIVYCFEPNEHCYNEITKKKYDDKFKIYNYGISDTDGYSKFNNCDHYGYSSILDFDDKGDFFKLCEKIDTGFNNILNIRRIKIKRLDTFIKENNINKIDLLKIDTQGHDLNIVKSLGNYINIVDTIMLECQIKTLYKNSHTKDEIVNYMNNNNFKLIKEEYTSQLLINYEENLTFKRNVLDS